MILPEPPSGRFDGSCHLFALRVYFEDTDFSGVVYHANYLRWFERARSDMLRLLGIDQRAAFDGSEGAYAVADLALRYVAPARLDDAVLIRSEVTSVSAATCRVHQRALRGPDLLCEGHLRMAFVAPNGRPRRQPASWLSAIAEIVTPRFPDEGSILA